MTEADYTPIPTPTYDDLVDGGFRNAEMIDRLQRKIERLRAALAQIADGDSYYDGAAGLMKIAREALNAQEGG